MLFSILLASLAVTGFSEGQSYLSRKLLEWADLKAGKGPVYGQGWSPDGNRIVTADFDQIRVWNATNGRELASMKGHTEFIWGLAWAPDGKVVASASQDGSVRLWSMEDYKQIKQLQTGWAFCVAWLPDGKKLVTGNRGGFVQIWDRESGELIQTFKSGNYSFIISVACSPDGKTIAAGRLNGEIELWDVERSQVRLTLNNYSESRCDVNGLAWSPDGSLLATTGEDKKIYLWDTKTWEKYAWEEHSFLPVWSISWSPDGKKVASGAGKYETPHTGATIIWIVPSL